MVGRSHLSTVLNNKSRHNFGESGDKLIIGPESNASLLDAAISVEFGQFWHDIDDIAPSFGGSFFSRDSGVRKQIDIVEQHQIVDIEGDGINFVVSHKVVHYDLGVFLFVGIYCHNAAGHGENLINLVGQPIIVNHKHIRPFAIGDLFD